MILRTRTNTVKDEKGDVVADSHSILARWRNHFCQLLNIHGVNDGRQTEIDTAEPLLPEPSAVEVQLAMAKLKSRCARIKTFDKWYLFTEVMCNIQKGNSRMEHVFSLVMVCNTVTDIYSCI